MVTRNGSQKLIKVVGSILQACPRIKERELMARDLVRVVSILVADRCAFPEFYLSTVISYKNTHLLEAVSRNHLLVTAFADFFGQPKIKWDEYCCEALLFNEHLVAVHREDLLHIPGWVYEATLAGDRLLAESASRRKKQGSYFTPLNIVRYMIEKAFESLGRKLVHSGSGAFRVLDPACGGASFLLEVCKKLAGCGFGERAAIESIYGIDSDEQAVILSRFVLTVLVWAQSGRSFDPALAKLILQNRIKTGNALSLLGEQPSGIVPGEEPGNLIDWARAFPQVFSGEALGAKQGFDLVIGNPPYVSNKLIPLPEKKYYQAHYQSAKGQFDLSVPFVEQGLRLLKEDRVLCYITSNKFMAADYGKNIRRELLFCHRILELVDVSTLNVFANTAVYPIIMTVRKGGIVRANGVTVTVGHNLETNQNRTIKVLTVRDWPELSKTRPITVRQDFFSLNDDYLITTSLDKQIIRLVKKVFGLGEHISRTIIKCGLAQTGFNKWVVKGKARDCTCSDDGFRPFIQAGHIKPYYVAEPDVIDTSFLKAETWQNHRGGKLVIPGIATTLRAAVDYSDSLLGRVYYIMAADTDIDLHYLVVLLNSQVLNFYYRVMYWSVHLAGGYLRFNSGYLANLPVYLGARHKSDAKYYLVSEITALGRYLVSAEHSGEEVGEMVCRAEALVFKLYSLNSGEADAIMQFLGLPAAKREKIKMLIKEV